MKRSLLKLAILIIASASVFGQQTRSRDVDYKRMKWPISYDFSPSLFLRPPLSSGPLTRWWWPGNDVENKELKREIALFADMGFAGVEIQAFVQGLNLRGDSAQLKRQFSWDTPSFYEHLRTVMESARGKGMIVDMNAGSGWPMGGPSIKPQESLLTLAYADTLIKGKVYDDLVPLLKQGNFTYTPGRAQLMQTISVSFAKLQAVIAAKVLGVAKEQTILDQNTVQDLTSKVINGRLNWKVPEGKWKVIAFYSMPDGELPKVIASQQKGFVVDHLDSNKVKSAYEYLLAPRSGLKPYFGNPLRAVFNDSYEFMTDRHYASNFLSTFQKLRGYSIVPYLPVNMKKFYNNAYIAPIVADRPFDFSFSAEDWRIRYDYDVTVGELLREQFIKRSNRWLKGQGLLHRTQAYGVRMDVIGGSGAAEIPETEQLAGGNSEGFLKLVSSGAHLYNKPIISQESFVFMGLAEMMTPQKMRILADKSFAAGVNQIIYHGTPYKYQTGEFGNEGWVPFSSPFNPGINFSSTFNESFSFWNDIKTVNQYIARCQYILQAGKAKAEVLIYFPFNDLMPEQVFANPLEILKKGRLEGIDPKVSTQGGEKENLDRTEKWFKELWPVINRLESMGITWDFVNDEALLQSNIRKGKIEINGNQYLSLVMANLPYISLSSAQKINELSRSGASLLVYGKAPAMQPSFFNFKENDELTEQLILQALNQKGTAHLIDETSLFSWAGKLRAKLRFNGSYNLVRSSERLMSDGNHVKFIWNESDQKQKITVANGTEHKYFYWLNAESGDISRADAKNITYEIQPYSSVFLLASHNNLAAKVLSAVAPIKKGEKSIALENWDIKIGDTTLVNAGLFDWSKKEGLQYRSDHGYYRTSFNIKTKDPRKRYLLDLGHVFFTVKLHVNGKFVGKRIWAPYQFDITSLLKSGNNIVNVEVTPTNRNLYIAEAENGNPKYNQFKRKKDTLMPAGLLGPVKVVQYPK